MDANRDGSDETTENCMATECPRYAFRCMYGACVSGNSECNRARDCAGIFKTFQQSNLNINNKI